MLGLLRSHVLMLTCLLLIGLIIGCDKKQQLPPEPPEPETGDSKDSEKVRSTEEIQWEYIKKMNCLSPAQSREWLRNNYFEVRRTEDGRGYIITINYYDPGPPSRRYDKETPVRGYVTVSIEGPQGATVTIDPEGQLRVRPDNH